MTVGGVEGWSVVYPFPTSPHMRARVIREIGRILHHPPPLHPDRLRRATIGPVGRQRTSAAPRVRRAPAAWSGAGATRGQTARSSERVHPRVGGHNSFTRRFVDRASARSWRAQDRFADR
jgi:hypothetical protein